MYISKVKIKNFKIFKDVTIHFNEHFNLIIGKNNSGKSTMMEAIRLWQMAFFTFLKESSKKSSDKRESSFYAKQYFSFIAEDVEFLRITDFKMLFFDSTKKMEIAITLTQNDLNVDLPIIFDRDTEEKKLRFQLGKNNGDRKEKSIKLNNLLSKREGDTFKNALLISYISPLFNLTNKEPQYTKGYILNLIKQAKSNEIIRNILYNFTNDYNSRKIDKSEEIDFIEKKLGYILYNINDSSERKITFSRLFNKDKNQYIKIYAKKDDEKKPIEISQLGSGILNLLNILSILEYGDYNKYVLNVLLLDEPDSHLHADFQKRLFEVLNEIAKDNNKQMFVVTHNHELIEAADEVLYIDSLRNEISAIPKDQYYMIYKEIATDFHKKMLYLSDAKKRIENLSKPTLFVEGETDKKIIITAFEKLYEKKLLDYIDVVVPGMGCSGIACNLKATPKSEYKIIGLFDRDKAGIEQYKGLCKTLKISTQKSSEEGINDVLISEQKSWFVLPLPESRKESADWFNENTCIEYLFEDGTLEKMEISLVQKKGNTYKTIKSSDANKLDDSVKDAIQKKLSTLDKEDFRNFIPIFKKIAEILQDSNFTILVNNE